MAGGNAKADSGPIQLSLFSPVQIIQENHAVEAFRFSLIYGRNKSVTGLDLGLVNVSTGGVSKGIQYGIIGVNNGSFIGWQSNFVSMTSGTMEGLQMGAFTSNGHTSGIQIGILNMTETMNGVQLGLLNFISKDGFLPFFPIVNWSFR
ncbi:MAG: hypothetical protein OEV30_08840 [Ignavibacteria bacterium]|nr:hypothetical protein [Ignavibacteria bacterium]